MAQGTVYTFGFSIWIKALVASLLAAAIVGMGAYGQHNSFGVAVLVFAPWVAGMGVLTYLVFARPALAVYPNRLEYRTSPIGAAMVVTLRKIASITVHQKHVVLTSSNGTDAVAIPLNRFSGWARQEVTDYFVDARIRLRHAREEQADSRVSEAYV